MVSPVVKQSWAVSGVLLNMLAQGMVLSYPSVLMPALTAPDSVIRTDLETASWISSLVGLACLPGFLASSLLMELVGRRRAHALVIVPGGLGWLLIYLAKDVPTLVAGRVLGGVTAGATVTLGAVVIGEYTSPRLRGMFLNLKTAAVCVGNAVVHVLGHYFDFQTVALMGVVPHVIAFMIVCTWPESPAWLAARQNYHQSEKAWLWLRGDAPDSLSEFDSIIRAQKERKTASSKKTGFKDHVVEFLKKFTKKDFLKPLLLIVLAGILLETCGRHIFPAYALQIIHEITGDKSQSYYYTLTIDIITTFSSTFSSVLVRMLKRRTLLFVSGGAALVVLMGSCACVYLTSIGVISRDRAWLPVAMFMLYFTLANLGCTPIPLALLGEVFPIAHRGAGSAMSGLSLSLCLMIALKITPALLLNVKVYGTFAIYGCAMAATLVALYFTLPETKDRTLQEIEDFFNHGRFTEEVRDEENSKMLKS